MQTIEDSATPPAPPFLGLDELWRDSSLAPDSLETKIAGLRASIEASPDETVSWHRLGVESLRLGRPDDAEAAFRAAIRQSPDFSPALTDLACLLRSRGDIKGALRFFRAACAGEAKNARLRAGLGEALLLLGEDEEAVAHFLAALQEEPKFAPALSGLGQALQRRGDLAGAIERFGAAVEVDPESPWLRGNLAGALMELGRLDEAGAAFAEVLRRRPDFAPALNGLGLIARRRGNREIALSHFDAATVADPANIWFRHSAAVELLALGRLVEAEQRLEPILGHAANPAAIFETLGQIKLQRRDFGEAVAHFQAASEAAPENKWRQASLAAALAEGGRLDEADGVYAKVLAIDPRFSPALNGLAHLHRRRGDHQAALAHFRLAREAEPNNLWYAISAAHEMIALRQFDEAVEVFRTVLGGEPHLAVALNGLAIALRERGDHEAALSSFRAAAAEEPTNFWVRRSIPIELSSLGRHGDAEAEARAVVTDFPQSAQGLLDLAAHMRRQAGADATSALVKRAVELEPKHNGARCALAGLHLETGEVEAADAIYDAVLSDDAESSTAWIGKGLVARARGRRRDAASAFQKAASSSDEPTMALLEIVEEMLATNRIAEARAMAAEIVAKNPSNIAALSKLGRIETLAGRYDRAFAIYSEVAQRYPEATAADIERARIAYLDDNPLRAVQLVAELLARRPDCAEAFELLAEFAASAGNLSAAAGLYRRALERAPWRSDLVAPMAHILVKLARFTEATSLIEARLIRDGRRADLYSSLAETYDEIGLTPSAKRILAEGRQTMPEHFSLWRHDLLRRIRYGEFEYVRDALGAREVADDQEAFEISWLAANLAAAEWDIETALRLSVQSISGAEGDSWKYEFAARMALLSNNIALAKEHMNAHLRLHRAQRGVESGARNVWHTFVGHLIAEMALKPESAATIARIIRETPVSAIEGLLDFMRQDPDYTPTAVAFFVHLRRNPKTWSPRGGSRAGAPNPIPRRIIQFWNDEQPPHEIAEYCETWRIANPAFAYRRYSAASARAWLVERRDPELTLAFDRAREPAMQADLFRLAILYEEGGYYADADDRCLSSLDVLTDGRHGLILYQEDLGSLGNNFIAAAPRHPAIAIARDNAVAAVLRGDSEMVWLSTGPGLITRSVARWIASGGDPMETLGEIRILARHELFRVVAIHCSAAYKHTDRYWGRRELRGKKGPALREIQRLCDDFGIPWTH